MMKTNLLSAVVTLGLALPGTAVLAQNTATEEELLTTPAETPEAEAETAPAEAPAAEEAPAETDAPAAEPEVDAAPADEPAVGREARGTLLPRVLQLLPVDFAR